jgi:hypothetical protein
MSDIFECFPYGSIAFDVESSISRKLFLQLVHHDCRGSDIGVQMRVIAALVSEASVPKLPTMWLLIALDRSSVPEKCD